MLAADKDRLIAGLKQHALSLRHKELDYFVERYSNLATQVRRAVRLTARGPAARRCCHRRARVKPRGLAQASILAGFAFDSLVELDITPEMHAAEWLKVRLP